ncbi:GntR family transcriptional regulator (plasmid) [Streptomycetaceae bacterium NBC_01309]
MSAPATLAPRPHPDGTEPCLRPDVDPDVFFPDYESDAALAAAAVYCRACPRIAECLAWAVDSGEAGIWAATTTAQRAQLREQHGITTRIPGLTLNEVATMTTALKPSPAAYAPGTPDAVAAELARQADADDAPRRTSPWEDVAADLAEQIRSGALPEGAAVPTLKELADTYDVSITAAQRAVSQLDHDGLVSSGGRGRRTIVTPTADQPATAGALPPEPGPAPEPAPEPLPGDGPVRAEPPSIADVIAAARATGDPKLTAQADKTATAIDALAALVGEHQALAAAQRDVAWLEAQLAAAKAKVRGIKQGKTAPKTQPAADTAVGRRAVDPRRVRAWAADNHIDCNSQGIVRREVVDAYLAAMHAEGALG